MPLSLDRAIQEALRLHQAGELQQAETIYLSLLRHDPGQARVWHLLGVVCQQTGQLQEAIKHLRRALELDPRKAVYHNNFGVALRGLGRLDEAEQAFGRALELNASYVDAHSNLGVTLHELGRRQQALTAFEQALQLRPDHPDALFNCGNLLQDLGRYDDAVAFYRRALAVQPNRPQVQNNLGNTFLSLERPAEAVECYRRAVSLAPSYAEAHLNLGAAYMEQEDVEEAARCFETAAVLRPDKPLWRLRSLSLSPAVFATEADLDRYRERLADRLDACRNAALAIDVDQLASDGFTPSFHLAHHGRDNRPLMEKFAALYEPHFPKHAPRVRPGKPRIGFLVTRPHESGFVRTMGGMIERLDGERFQPVILCSEGALSSCRSGIRREDLKWVSFPDRFREAAARIAAAECNLLYHRKIGADPLGYYLPFARLAPVQCTSWGTHTTSGVRAVDYYVSSRLAEAEGAEEHFTETLFSLDSLPSYQRRPSPLPPAQRSDFGLPEQGGLYLAPQRLAKFHPAQDDLFRRVLEEDPEGHLVVLSGRSHYALRQLLTRWEKTLGAAAKRVIVLPAQSPQDFRRLLSVGDALLDIRHYGVSLVAYDAFAVRLPIVTLPGRFTVERLALAFYRRMGVEDLIAQTPEQYVELAVRLGTDRDFRMAMRALIGERSDVLFEDPWVVREHERFFEHALASRP